jgi:hypothetical protein
VGRAVPVLFLLAALATGCGGSKSSAGTIDSILARPGPDVAVTEGAGDFVPGLVRYPFMVIRNDARPVNRPTARIWVATGRDAKPFERTTARLEPIGVPGLSAPAAGDVNRLYVAHVRIRRPGRYWLVAAPSGARIQAVGVFDVHAHSPTPAVGAPAPASGTPTLADAPAARLTTRRPPDLALLRYSVADSLRAHRPFVVTFATPRFCTSRICGPVVDVVEAVRRRFASGRVRFIHVEVFTDNDPAKGYNRWMRQWGLRSEPWTFLVGGDGRVKAKFEGSVSEAELAAAVRRTLL